MIFGLANGPPGPAVGGAYLEKGAALAGLKHAMKISLALVMVALLAAPAPAFAGLGGATKGIPRAQNQAPRPMGSLTASGPVTLNGAAAPPGATVFAGDILATGEAGTATFALSGKGALKLAPQSQIVVSEGPQYIAELKAGTLVMNSFQGATDVVLRAGNYLVGPVIQGEPSVSEIGRDAGGSFQIPCVEGNIAVLPMDGASGRFLQAGQSVTISPQGELLARAPQPPQPQPPPPSQPAPETKPEAKAAKSNNSWIILGLAGGGAAAAIAALAGHHGAGGGTPVSPSVP